MSYFLNRVRFATSTTGQGTIDVGAAYSNSFTTPMEAGGVSGRTYTWVLEEGNDFEIFRGVLTDASPDTVTRATVLLSRIAGVYGTTKMTLGGLATCRCIVAKEDLEQMYQPGGTDVAVADGGTGASDAAGARVNLYASPADSIARYGAQHNGNKLISQLNGTTVLTSSGAYPVDGMTVKFSGAMALNHSQKVNSPFSSNPHVTTAVEIEITTADASVAAGDFLIAEHRIEGYQVYGFGWGTSAARPVSIGYLLRANTAIKGYISVTNSATSRSYHKAFDLASNTDNYVPITIPGDTSGTWLTDTGIGLTVRIAFMAGSTYQGTADAWNAANNLGASDIGNLCASVGNKAWLGPFIIVPGGDGASAPELPSIANLPSVLPKIGADEGECGRYLESWQNDSAGSFSEFVMGAASATTIGDFPFYFNRRKRATPACVYSSLSHFAVTRNGFGTPVGNPTALDFFRPNTYGTYIRATYGSAVFTAAELVGFGADGTDVAKLFADARL